jgi:hypothetical protein
MDIGAGRGTCPGQFTRANAATGPPNNGACFSCQETGHFARNCPKYPRQQRPRIRYANNEPEEIPPRRRAQARGALIQEEYDDLARDPVEEHIRSFKAMGSDERRALVNRIDSSDPEDFPST